ncbi:MAG: FkbM family methyltransferase [Candidatus Eiseniibacteriota bacterium]
MKAAVKRLLIGTRWEEPLKRLHHAVTGSRNTLYDWQTIAIMRRVLRPDSNAIDVGAFEGGMLRHMVRLAPRGRHLAFEPVPERAAVLAARFPQADVHAAALGDAAGHASFQHVIRHPALSGLRRRSDLVPDEEVREIQVPVTTLDMAVPADQPVALVKIDVEGGELGVFRGGVETFRRTRPVVIFECGLGSADAYGVEPEEVYDAVTGPLGLRVSLLQDWLAGSGALSRASFADLYRRRIHFYFIAHP